MRTSSLIDTDQSAAGDNRPTHCSPADGKDYGKVWLENNHQMQPQHLLSNADTSQHLTLFTSIFWSIILEHDLILLHVEFRFLSLSAVDGYMDTRS